MSKKKPIFAEIKTMLSDRFDIRASPLGEVGPMQTHMSDHRLLKIIYEYLNDEQGDENLLDVTGKKEQGVELVNLVGNILMRDKKGSIKYVAITHDQRHAIIHSVHYGQIYDCHKETLLGLKVLFRDVR